MQAGRLRHRVVVQQKTETQDATGNVAVTWATIATCWASVEPLSGRELLQSEQMQAEASIRVRMRYMAGITPHHRLRNGERTLNIISVSDPQQRHVELELLCVEQGV